MFKLHCAHGIHWTLTMVTVNFFKVSGALFMYFHACDYQVNLHNNTLGADATILPISERWKLRPTEVKYIIQKQK